MGKWPSNAHLQDKTISIKLIWIKYAGSCKSQGHYLYLWACPCGTDGQMITILHMYRPMSLILSESAQLLLSNSIHNVPRALIRPVGMYIWARQANDHKAAHVQDTAVPMNFIWSELTKNWQRDRDNCKVPIFLWKGLGTIIGICRWHNRQLAYQHH